MFIFFMFQVLEVVAIWLEIEDGLCINFIREYFLSFFLFN